MRAWCTGGVLLLALAGCGSLGTTDNGQAPAVVEDVSGPGVATLLAEHARLRKLPAAELGREQDNARAAFLRSRSDGNRMRYALSLAVPGAGAADEARALEVLEPVIRNGNSAWHGLAVLTASFLQEQRRRDAQAQDLQQKLDALLALERNMIGRENTGARKK